MMDASCGIGYLGVINDVHWVTATDEIPPAWAEAVEPDGDLLVRVRLRTKPEPHARVSLGGTPCASGGSTGSSVSVHAIRSSWVLRSPWSSCWWC